MSEMVIYALKSLLSFSIFALLYKFVLFSEGNFRIRRFYLLISAVISIVLPFSTLAIPLGNSIIPSVLLDEVVVYSNGIRLIRDTSALPFSQVVRILYILIAGFLAVRIIMSTLIILNDTSKNNHSRDGRVKLFQLSGKNISYSFFRNVFIGQTADQEELKRILAHEKVHAIQLHSIDVMFIEVLTCLFWFNPLVWWYRNEIKNVHEYLADQGALETGFNMKEYQITLLEHLIGSASLIITNSFNYSLIKNRIAMMHKEKNKKNSTWKLFLLIPVTMFIAILFACTQNNSLSMGGSDMDINDTKTAYYEVEQMPEFPGGIDGLRKEIAMNITYPAEAAKHNVAGKVYIQFVVGSDGKIATDTKDYIIYDESRKETQITGQVTVVGYKAAENSTAENADPYIELLKKEAVRVVSNLPAFEKPGMIKGKPVAVVFTVPINFALQ